MLYRYHGVPLYNYILRLVRDAAVAENLLQEVFVAAWRGAGRFGGRSAARTWLFRIAHHQAVSWLRRERGEVSLDGVGAPPDWAPVDGAPRPDAPDGSAGFGAGGSDVEATAWSAWRADRIREALDRLTPDHRAVVELVFFHDLPYAEVAEVLDCPVGTVKSRMSWARHHLRRALKDLDGDGD